jgi:hypothetical protein
MRMYVCSLANADAEVKGPPCELITDDPAKVDAFVRQHDRPGRGVFFCPNPLKPDATRRAKETIEEVATIGTDIDAKDIAESPQTVDQRLQALPCPPTRINDSGHGRHAFWDLKEPVDTHDAETMAALDRLQKQLVEIVCGDPAVSHHATLLRLVGSHNSKHGDWLEVRTVRDGGPTYYLEGASGSARRHRAPDFHAQKDDRRSACCDGRRRR